MELGTFLAEDLPKLLELLYGAAVDNDQWPIFLQALVKPFDGANGVLHFFDIESQSTPKAHTFGLETDYLLSYQEHFSNINPYPIQAFARLRTFDVLRATEVLSREEALKTEFYHDWMKPQGITPDHLGCMIHSDSREFVVMAIAPSGKHLERDADRYTKQFALLTPHLKRAIALSKLNRSVAVGAVSPAQFACGALTIKQSRIVRSVNPQAEQFLKEANFLAVDPLGKLYIRDPEVQNVFQLAVDAVFSRQEPIGGPVRFRVPLSDTLLSIVVLKLSMDGPQTALVLLIPNNGSLIGHATAQFTTAEARLAKALLNGKSLSDFSNEVGISINTARKQLAALFAKTGTNRQAALVAWLLQRGP